MFQNMAVLNNHSFESKTEQFIKLMAFTDDTILKSIGLFVSECNISQHVIKAIYICICMCMYIFFLFFQSNDDKITFISLYNVLGHVCICLPLTLIGYSYAVNKILFYSILFFVAVFRYFSPLITFSFGPNLSMVEYQIKLYY